MKRAAEVLVPAAIAALLSTVTVTAHAGEAPAAAVPAAARAFAHVGDTVISVAEYEAAFQAAKRQKYYHGKPPDGEVAALQREVGDRLVNRVLLLAEAKKRGVEPDREKVREVIAGYDRQYGGSPQWKANRERMLAAVTPQLELQSMLDRFEAETRRVRDPAPAELRAYYDANQKLFTQPEQLKVSLILLKVDPSSPRIAWDKAHEEAESILKRLQRGADFGQLARVHSSDASGQRGGDLGYLHRGMLPQGAQEVVDKLERGTPSSPVTLLEGVAIIRVDDRRAAHLMEFEKVSARAADLWRREQGEQQWQALVARLRKGAQIRIDPAHYPEISQAARP